MRHTITITVNGEPWSIDVDPNDVLLDVLRTRLGVKSPKVGCESGDCGTCTVLLDGRTVRSCLILAVEADGCDIVTVEGLSRDGPTPLQQAFVERNAFQCGFCAPGMVLAATELLEHNATPTEEEVREALAGHLCRCTGYEPIVEAVLGVASTADSADHSEERPPVPNGAAPVEAVPTEAVGEGGGGDV
jgi:carbon-monoxide dehydrogenase small subunit